MNRIIWVIRERRCGGTWFVQRLARHLLRESHMFELFPRYLSLPLERRFEFFRDREQEQKDYDRILNTHDFAALQYLKKYDDPIVFRILRRDKVEQFLSLYHAKLTDTFNIFHESEKFKTTGSMIVFPKDEIDRFVKNSIKQEMIWNQLSAVENETVYYEDLLEGFQSKLLPDINFDMNVKDEEELNTLRLPYNKQDIFLNYRQIREYIELKFGSVA